MEEQNNKKKSHGFLTFIIVILILGGVIFGAIKFISCINSDNGSSPSHTLGSTSGANSGSGNSTPQLFSRSANNGDISVQYSENITTLSDEFKIKPNVDIKNLSLTFTFYDSNLKSIKSISKNVGNVSKGLEFTVTISITEFSFTEIFKISKVSTSVTGGTVSYFA